MESSIVASTIASLIQTLNVATTTLKPPPPDFTPEPFPTYISDLALLPSEIELIPQESISSWKSHIFHTRQPMNSIISDDSLGSKLIDYVVTPIVTYEHKQRQNLLHVYHAQTDEVDRIALSQLWSIVSGGWRYMSRYIAHTLAEGTFLGYNDQQKFDKATCFSFQRMMHHAVSADALKELTFHYNTLPFIDARLPQIERIVTHHLEKYKLWRYRWMTAEKVTMLEVILTFQSELYANILADRSQETSRTEKSETLKNYNKTNDLLAELKASYFNFMVEIKPKSWLEQKCQDGINAFTDALSYLYEDSISFPRLFIEVYRDALETATFLYNHLSVPIQRNQDFQPALEGFIKAISEDNFFLAKWITLSTLTPDANFNWLEKAVDFEDYKRAIDHLIHTQNQIDEFITQLYTINDQLFSSYLQAQALPTSGYKNRYRKIKSLIHDLWDFRNQIDEFRLSYRLAYLKKIRTTVNTNNIGYWDRFFQSAVHKVKRATLTGNFFDQTETQEQVLSRLRLFRTTYNQKIAKTAKLVTSLPLTEQEKTNFKILLKSVE